MSWYLYRLRARRPDFSQTMSDDEMAVMQAHIDYWQKPLDEGRVLIYSPVADPGHSWGLAIIRVDSEDELRQLRDSDPAYTNGVGEIDWLLLPMATTKDQPPA